MLRTLSFFGVAVLVAAPTLPAAVTPITDATFSGVGYYVSSTDGTATVSLSQVCAFSKRSRSVLSLDSG